MQTPTQQEGRNNKNHTEINDIERKRAKTLT